MQSVLIAQKRAPHPFPEKENRTKIRVLAPGLSRQTIMIL
jgi:hypothetical protein